MIKLVRTLPPEYEMGFEEICSFKTENYVGIYNYATDRFVVMAQSDCELHLITLPTCRTLDRLDMAVYDVCREHIIGVSDNSAYTFMIKEEE